MLWVTSPHTSVRGRRLTDYPAFGCARQDILEPPSWCRIATDPLPQQPLFLVNAFFPVRPVRLR
jgi:hypothetical protein